MREVKTSEVAYFPYRQRENLYLPKKEKEKKVNLGYWLRRLFWVCIDVMWTSGLFFYVKLTWACFQGWKFQARARLGIGGNNLNTRPFECLGVMNRWDVFSIPDLWSVLPRPCCPLHFVFKMFYLFKSYFGCYEY